MNKIKFIGFISMITSHIFYEIKVPTTSSFMYLKLCFLRIAVGKINLIIVNDSFFVVLIFLKLKKIMGYIQPQSHLLSF